MLQSSPNAIFPSLRQMRRKLKTPHPVVSSVCPAAKEIRLATVPMLHPITRRDVFASEGTGLGAPDTRLAAWDAFATGTRGLGATKVCARKKTGANSSAAASKERRAG